MNCNILQPKFFRDFVTYCLYIFCGHTIHRDDGTVRNFLDYANMEHEGGEFNVNQIEDVRRLWKLCKVFLLTIPYWMCYSQV